MSSAATRAATRAPAIALCVLLIFGSAFAAAPASADGGNPSAEGYAKVQQALGYLATDPMAGMDAALAKIDAALSSADQDGVNVADVQRAKTALQSGNVAEARTLLQGSITVALSQLAPAVGEQTGTKDVLDPLNPGWKAENWLLLPGSLLVVIVGAALAYAFRPHDDISALRSLLGRRHRVPDGRGEPEHSNHRRTSGHE